MSKHGTQAKKSHRKQRVHSVPEWASVANIPALHRLQTTAGEYVRLIRETTHRRLGNFLEPEGESENQYAFRERLRREQLADEFENALTQDAAHRTLLHDANYVALVNLLARCTREATAGSSLRAPEAKAASIEALVTAIFGFVVDTKTVTGGWRLTPTRKDMATARRHCEQLLLLGRVGLYSVPAFLGLYEAAERFLLAQREAKPVGRPRVRAARASGHQPKKIASERFQKELRGPFANARKFRQDALNRFNAFVGYKNPYTVSP